MHDMMIHVDPTGQQSAEEVRRLAPGSFVQPKATSGNALNFGFTPNAYWIKLTLQRAQDAPSDWIIEIPYLGLDQIDFYAPGEAPVLTGAARSTSSRPLFNRYFIFPVKIGPTPQTYYFRFQSSYAMTIPLEIYTRHDFAESTQKTLIAQFLYFGGILALILYNLQLYISLRDKVYLLYALFGLFMGLGIFSGNGFGRLLLWPEWARWDQVSQSVLISIGAMFSVLFARNFLHTARAMPRLDLSLKGLAIGYFVISTGLLFATLAKMELSIWHQALMALTPLYFALITAAAVQTLRTGHQSSKYYLIAWFFLCAGVVIATLRTFDWVPTNTLTAYAIQIGMGLDMLLLSYALAHRVRSEQIKRAKAQQEVIDTKNQMVEALRASEEQLEALVTERTSQLQASLTSEKLLHEQYVRFGSMISHEFRNPLNNIQAQTDLLVRERQAGIDRFERRVGVISAAIQQLGLLFDRWVQSDRINNELALRNVDNINLNEWIGDLTRRYQASVYNHRIAFQPAIEDVTVLADQALLQIALINLLDNACKYSMDGTEVRVGIVTQNHLIGIYVEDAGEGIDPTHHALVFEERFRVNNNHPSRGTGLGLAFVKKIAELHHGQTSLISTLGNGATFTLWLQKPKNKPTEQSLSNRH